MSNTFLLSVEKIASLFLLLGIGFLLGKKRILPQGSSKVLSLLETKLFLPALIFYNLSSNFSLDKIEKYLNSFLFGLVFLAISLIISFAISFIFSKEKNGRKFYTYIFAFSNYAYFGYPVIESVLGAQILSNMIIFALPFTVTIFTLGVYLLRFDNGQTEKALNSNKIYKSILSPVIMSVILGITCGILKLTLPSVIKESVYAAASCMGPVSMILIGLVLSAFPFKDLFLSGKAFIVSIVRLIILPFFFGSVLWLSGVRGNSFILPVIMSAMPVGMNLIIFPEADGQDSKNNGRICFVSYLLAFLTIPLMFSLIINFV